MADRTQKYYRNVPGKFYVQTTCLDCDACRTTAPMNFRRDELVLISYVHKQPENAEEESKVRDAMDGCPCESIGDDGDLPDARNDSSYCPPESSDPDECMRWLLARVPPLVAPTPTCLIQTDAKGRFTRFDAAAEEFFNCPASEAIGKLHYSAVHDPDQMKACANDPKFKAKMVDPGFTEDVWMIIPRGSDRKPFNADVTLLPLRRGPRQECGEITGFLAHYRRLGPECFGGS